VLRESGWDGKTPILVICPIHPFVWPVKASIAKYAARVTTGAYKDSQYRTVYFHESGRAKGRAPLRALRFGITNATKAFLQRHRVFPILVAMEAAGRRGCREIEKQIPATPFLLPDDYDMFQVASICALVTYMVSSRYHGIVTCMPASWLPRCHHGMSAFAT